MNALDQICAVNGYAYSVYFHPKAVDPYEVRVHADSPRRVRIIAFGQSLAEAAFAAHGKVHQEGSE